MRKGAIVLTPFPFTDLVGQKVRPALILAIPKSGEDAIIAFISSQKIKRQGSETVTVLPSEQNRLKLSSVIRIDKIATVQKKIILGELGHLEESCVREVDKKLRSLFSL